MVWLTHQLPRHYEQGRSTPRPTQLQVAKGRGKCSSSFQGSITVQRRWPDLLGLLKREEALLAQMPRTGLRQQQISQQQVPRETARRHHLARQEVPVCT